MRDETHSSCLFLNLMIEYNYILGLRITRSVLANLYMSLKRIFIKPITLTKSAHFFQTTCKVKQKTFILNRNLIAVITGNALFDMPI